MKSYDAKHPNDTIPDPETYSPDKHALGVNAVYTSVVGPWVAAPVPAVEFSALNGAKLTVTGSYESLLLWLEGVEQQVRNRRDGNAEGAGQDRNGRTA